MASSRQRLQTAGGTASHEDRCTLQVRDEGRVSAVSVWGRLGEGSDAELRRVVRSLRRAGVLLLILDLHNLDEIDPVGMIAVLEMEAEGRDQQGWELAVVPPDPRVAPEFSSAELREILCLVVADDARYMLDFYAASMRATASGLGTQRRGH